MAPGAGVVVALKWIAPLFAVAGAGILAVDTTAVTVGVIAAAQALVLGVLGYRQHVGDRRGEANRLATEVQATKVSATDKFVDQLQEQLNRESEAREADRLLISQQSTAIRELQKSVTMFEVGAVRLVAQLEAHDLVPAWDPSQASTGERPPAT